MILALAGKWKQSSHMCTWKISGDFNDWNFSVSHVRQFLKLSIKCVDHFFQFISKAACKCTGFVHYASSQHVELNKLSAFEHPVERCWAVLSLGILLETEAKKGKDKQNFWYNTIQCHDFVTILNVLQRTTFSWRELHSLSSWWFF